MPPSTSTPGSAEGALRVALITGPEHPGLRPDDVGLVEAFAALGATAAPLPWGSAVPSGRFDVAVIRTPWDYFLRPDEFMTWLDGLAVPVLNPKEVVRWNLNKGYLQQLSELGVAEIPRTARVEAGEGDTAHMLDLVGSRRAVIKPVISGGAHGTRIVSAEEPLCWDPSETGTYIIQEFMDSVTELGEWSLIYFGGEFSHSVLKVPSPGDFRVQDDFGGAVRFERPPEPLFETAASVLAGAQRTLDLPHPLPYARVDLVEAPQTRLGLLMELELIEPELFFRAAPASQARFAQTILTTPF